MAWPPVSSGTPSRQQDATQEVLRVAERPKAASVDEYMARLSPATRQVLERLRALVVELVPDAHETISYGIPTFDRNGRHVVFIAAYARHVGLYPLPHDLSAFEDELRPYKTGKGSVRFPLGEPLPVDLISRLVTAVASERDDGAPG
jgi:uncharacterized protein YdhG (YjbR/CyaY superfamily)